MLNKDLELSYKELKELERQAINRIADALGLGMERWEYSVGELEDMFFEQTQEIMEELDEQPNND